MNIMVTDTYKYNIFIIITEHFDALLEVQYYILEYAQHKMWQNSLNNFITCYIWTTVEE